MKKVILAITLFLSIFISPFCPFAQNSCPVKIRYKDESPCKNFNTNNAYYYWFEFESAYTGSKTIVESSFTHSNGNPCNLPITLRYPDPQDQCPPNNYYAIGCAHNDNPTGFIKFSDGKKCYYKDGLRVPCNDITETCADALESFAKDFLKTPGKDCKQWEGPCNTESEIFRTGFVGIGTPKTEGLQEGQLVVKGGIVTERLQICKPAWCDYVFSDTFRLRSLPEVEAYIKKYKHLPGSTPQADIEKKGGLSLDVETVNQQEKIEEAYLHLIALKKRMDRLAQKMPATVLQKTDNQQDRTKLQEQGPHISAAQLPERPNIVLNCTQLVPASSLTAADGIGGVKVTGIPVPFTITWTGPVNGNMTIDAECGGFIRLVDLKKGTYSITVGQPGISNATCQLVITNAARTDCALLEQSPCKEAILTEFKEIFSQEKPDCKQWEGDICSTKGNIYRLGNVCIGGSVGKSGYSLAVQGGILCDQFRVELCDDKWCDYVFDDHYPLLSLDEVHEYIQKHRHLPGIVSQAEVTDKGGFELRSVKLDQQEKIEEAYLYLLQLNSRAKQLRTQLDQQ